ncbi:uncharacterized protein LOC132870324 [Neoarius graeffei]|uniref:uncharacterized protein LOC132870324 n=1 Tax=Neoarius graeffei TaxID=443677 RepID=UPI00298D3D2A|nr:uncharacterized protein LOC132870324 [Neoarius graeffei]
MGPEESPRLKDTMPNTPPSSPHPHGCSPAPPSPCSTLPSPPISPAESGVVTYRSPATRHLAHLDVWRRHSWEPGAVVQGNPNNDTRSVSLEDLDVEEMALVLGGALSCCRARDTRRTVTCEGSLSSLTEEEAGIETQPHLCSPLEEQASQMFCCSVSAPSLCVVRHSKSSAPRPRPRSYCYDNDAESAPYYQGGGSTQSLDRELSSLRWEVRGETKGERDEDKEEVGGNAFVRTFSFLCKLTSSRKPSVCVCVGAVWSRGALCVLPVLNELQPEAQSSAAQSRAELQCGGTALRCSGLYTLNA